MEITQLLGNFSLTDLAEYLPKIQSGLAMAKDKLPLITEYEKTLNLKPDEKIIYSLIPIISDVKKEILFCGLIISRNEKGETVIVREAFKINALEKIDDLMSNIPKM